jgi:diguanylate cyclase (GGDEF)-like protein/hemerythrin-like metal-binding protein
MNDRASGEELLQAFERLPVAGALLDPDGRIDFGNRAFTVRFGPEGIGAGSLRAAASAAAEAAGSWRPVSLESAAGPVEARVVRLKRRTLLVIGEVLGSGSAGELAELRERVARLENDSATDFLTGAWNRAHFERVIGAELARSLESRRPVALVLFDIDHFKGVNDRFGHAAGDRVLREFVRVARANARASDVLFRWGGEEFALLVSSTGYRGAGVVAENVRKAVAACDFPGVGHVTVSAGVAESLEGEDAPAWFRRLDAALYEAKNGGRDRVVVDRRGNSDLWAQREAVAAPHLAWSEALECGDTTIDAEHRELFRLANELIDAAIARDRTTQSFLAAFDELLAHVAQHFADEEVILEDRGYLHLAEHRRAHAGLLRRARALREKVPEGTVRFGEVVEFLAQDVVARHLMTVDRAFFPLFAPGGG